MQPKMLQDLGTRAIGKSGKKVRHWRVECPLCFESFEAQSNSIKNGSTTQCKKCRYKQSSEKRNINRGIPQRIKSIHSNIVSRTENKNNKDYKRYGEKGIDMCLEWRNSIREFYKWASTNGYKEHLTIDRKDNLKGYNPVNCRWVTSQEQSENRIYNPKGKSGYVGVFELNGRQCSRLQYKQKIHYCGCYDTQEEAAIAYNNKCDELKLTRPRNVL